MRRSSRTPPRGGGHSRCQASSARWSSTPSATTGALDDADRADGDSLLPRTSAEHLPLEAELDALRILRNDRAVANTAMSALSELAARSDGHHRIPRADALIAAAAAEHGGLAVLHRDAHFDRLATVLHFQSVPLPGP